LNKVSVIEDPQYGVAVDYGPLFDDEKPITKPGISKPFFVDKKNSVPKD